MVVVEKEFESLKALNEFIEEAKVKEEKIINIQFDSSFGYYTYLLFYYKEDL